MQTKEELIEELKNLQPKSTDAQFRKNYLAIKHPIDNEFIRQIENNITRDYISTMIATLGLNDDLKEITFQFTPRLNIYEDNKEHIIKFIPDNNTYQLFAGYVYDINKICPFLNLQLNPSALIMKYNENLSSVDLVSERLGADNNVFGLFWENEKIITALKNKLKSFGFFIEPYSEITNWDNEVKFSIKIRDELKIANNL